MMYFVNDGGNMMIDFVCWNFDSHELLHSGRQNLLYRYDFLNVQATEERSALRSVRLNLSTPK